MAQDRYGQFGGDWRDRGQGYGRRRWPEGGREDFREGEGRAFRPGEDRDAWGFEDRRSVREREFGDWRRRAGEFGRDAYRDREGAAFADDRGEGWREFGRGPGRYDQDYPGPDLGGAWPERRREERSFRAGEHRGHGPKGYRRSDARIREDVCDRLADDPHLDARDIEVEVRSCEVILNGSVDSREDKRRAEMIADLVSGVDNVQNNLRAQPSPGAGQGQGLRQRA